MEAAGTQVRVQATRIQVEVEAARTQVGVEVTWSQPKAQESPELEIQET